MSGHLGWEGQERGSQSGDETRGVADAFTVFVVVMVFWGTRVFRSSLTMRIKQCAFVTSEAVFKGGIVSWGWCVLGWGVFPIPHRPHGSGRLQLCLLVPHADHRGDPAPGGQRLAHQAEPCAVKAPAHRDPGLTFQKQAETREVRDYVTVAWASGQLFK